MKPRAFAVFVVIGGLGFLIDAGVTQLLLQAGASPYLARIPAIALAVLFTWQANRRFAFRAGTKSSLGEAGRYGLVAALTACFNYLGYSALVSLGVQPFVAIVTVTAMQTVFSFLGYQRFVFRGPHDPSRSD